MIKVLFVCMGNICRSPMAEAVFQDRIDRAGLSGKIAIDSCGIGGWYTGEPAHSGTLRVLQQHGIPYDGRARQISGSDLDQFDYIFAMDYEVLSGLRRLSVGNGKEGQIEMFLTAVKESGAVTTLEVPDPYYNGRFDEVYELVTKGCDALLERIRAEHGL